jgi:hypothetical protein
MNEKPAAQPSGFFYACPPAPIQVGEGGPANPEAFSTVRKNIINNSVLIPKQKRVTFPHIRH